MTKIKYSKESLKPQYKIGFMLIGIGIAILLLSFVLDLEDISLFSVGIGQIGGGVFSYLFYYFQRKRQYLTFKNGELIKNSLFLQKIKLSEILYIKKFAGEYILKSKDKEFIINPSIIDQNSLLVLKSKLQNLDVTWS